MSEWISIKDELPVIGDYVALMDENRYANNGNFDPNNEHVVQAGYLQEFGGEYWSVYGERAMELNAFSHWFKLPEPPK